VDAAVSVLQILSVALWGVYAGAQLTEACVLVSYWRSLRPAEFFAWYAANDRRLISFFGPLTTSTALVSFAFAVSATSLGHASRGPAILAAVIALGVLGGFAVYFKGANARFAAGTISAEQLPGELRRWAFWHWVRTLSAFVALAVLLASLR
jgi:hypothetical protein